MAPIPLTRWSESFNNLLPIIPGTVRKPTLVDVHRTWNGQFACLVNIMDQYFEFFLQLNRGKCWGKDNNLMLRMAFYEKSGK